MVDFNGSNWTGFGRIPDKNLEGSSIQGGEGQMLSINMLKPQKPNSIIFNGKPKTNEMTEKELKAKEEEILAELNAQNQKTEKNEANKKPVSDEEFQAAKNGNDKEISPEDYQKELDEILKKLENENKQVDIKEIKQALEEAMKNGANPASVTENTPKLNKLLPKLPLEDNVENEPNLKLPNKNEVAPQSPKEPQKPNGIEKKPPIDASDNNPRGWSPNEKEISMELGQEFAEAVVGITGKDDGARAAVILNTLDVNSIADFIRGYNASKGNIGDGVLAQINGEQNIPNKEHYLLKVVSQMYHHAESIGLGDSDACKALKAALDAMHNGQFKLNWGNLDAQINQLLKMEEQNA